MKRTLLILACLSFTGCMCNDLYLGDKGWIHYKDDAGVWHPVQVAETAKPIPECESPIKNMDKCLDELQLRQH